MCAVRGRDVREERAAVRDEREISHLRDAGLSGMQAHVVDQHIEQDDRVLRLVSEWPVRRGWDRKRTGTGGVRFRGAAEMDDWGVSREGREVEHAKKHEAGLVIAIDHDLGYFERFLNQVGDHEGVLREETEK
jgi:hypothetical protein